MNLIKKPIFITIEGVDGTGKSTVAKLLASSIDAILISTPSQHLKEQRIAIENSDIQSQKFDFYTKAIIEQQAEIKFLLESSSIVCDRYIHSTFAYQWPNTTDLPNKINDFFKEIRPPDYSFLLIADETIRINRIKNREIETGIVNKSDYRMKNIKIANDRFLKMDELIKINTDINTPEEISNIIREYIENHQRI